MARKGRRGSRSYRRTKTDADRGKSLGSGLDEIGFEPLGHRIAVGGAREADWRLNHPTPIAAYYDHPAGRIVVEFENGSAFMVPARSMEGLADASDRDIAEVELLGEAGLHWHCLDVDHKIAALMAGIFGMDRLKGSKR